MENPVVVKRQALTLFQVMVEQVHQILTQEQKYFMLAVAEAVVETDVQRQETAEQAAVVKVITLTIQLETHLHQQL